MADWVRVSRGVKTDPKVYDLATRLNIPHESAIGLLVNLWVELPDHAKDGQIEKVPDQALEDWAAWRGKRGAFAKAYRDLFQTDDGRVNAWEKHNGRALARSEREAERVRQWREKRERTRTETRTDPTPNGNGTHSRTRSRTRTERTRNALRTHDDTWNETRRNGSTGEDPKVRGDPKESSPGGSAAPAGGWPVAWALAYHPIGILTPGRIGKRCAVVRETFGAERADLMWGHYIKFRPLMRFGEIVQGHHDVSGMGPEDFVKTAGVWSEYCETFDPAKHL